MWDLEPEVERLYNIYCRHFLNGYSPFSEEYETVYDEFQFCYACLEAVLDEDSFEALDRLMKAQEKIIAIHDRYYFSEGVRIGREVPKGIKTIDFS